jgi:alkylation response protein AidB-like acyl-CoA dehydrogenase
MDFVLNKEQNDIKKAARKFAAGEMVENTLDWDLAEETPAQIIRSAAELGFVGMTLPEGLDGAGMGLLEDCLVIEEFSSVSAGAARAILEPGWGTELLASMDPSDLPEGLAEGRCKLGLISSFQFPGAEAESHQLNGRLTLVPAGADLFLVPAARDGRTGFFLVPSGTPGLTLSRLESKLGLRAWQAADLELRAVDVRVLYFLSEADILARAGQAADIRLAAMAVGVARGASQIALAYTRNRRIFGQTLADFEATQDKFFHAWQGIEAARLLTLRAALEWDSGRDVALASAAARDWAIGLAQEISDEAVQLHGGYGYFEEIRVAMAYRDAKMLHLMAEPVSSTLLNTWPSLTNVKAW